MIRSWIFVAASLALLVGVSSADAQRRGGRARGGAVVVGRAAPRGRSSRRTARILRFARDAAPRGVRRVPIRFYQPYYTFRPRLSLSFGLTRVPSSVHVVLRLLRSVLLPVLSLRIRVSVPVSVSIPVFVSIHLSGVSPSGVSALYVSTKCISAFGVSASITATGISPVGVSAAGIDQPVAAEYRRHQLRDSAVGCTGL